MKRSLLLPWLIALSLLGAGQTMGELFDYPGAYAVRFDGVQKSATVYDLRAGVIVVARQLSSPSPEYIYVPVRRYGFFDGKFLRAEDLNGDGLQDVLLPAYSANRVLVLWGHRLAARELEFEETFVGTGPQALATGQLDGRPGHEALVATTAGRAFTIQGWNLVTRQPVSMPTVFPENFATDGLLGFETAARSRGAADPVLGILRRDRDERGGPLFEFFARNPAPEYGPANSIRRTRLDEPYTQLASGFPNGQDSPGWFMAWAPGLRTVTMLPSTSAGNDEKITIHGQHEVVSAQFIPDVDDEVLVTFANGAMELFGFTPGAGFSSKQQFNPPAGLNFVLGAGGNGSLFLLAANGAGQIAHFSLFEKSGANYVLTGQGAWPIAPALGGGVTVVLYTGNPFSSPPPFPFETFVAGDWTKNVSFAGGSVTATVETFGSTTEGLGNPAPQLLQPAANPGAGAMALGNQWEPSSSLFYLAPPMADGLAAVTIEPLPGTYPITIGVKFQAAPGVTVHYRVNQSPWQTGLGPVLITQTSTVEFYGQHTSGALSSIHSAHYQINQQLAADTDGDGVPDVIEKLAGTNPFLPDSDGDGANDFSEILAGTNPNDPTSRPDSLAPSFVTVKLAVAWENENSAMQPGEGQELFLADVFNQTLAPPLPKLRSAGRWAEVTVNRGVVTRQWLPSNFRLRIGGLDSAAPIGPAMTAFTGIPASPPPAIPIDLEAADPLAAWRQAAQSALEARARETAHATIGPASSAAALLFEKWFGARLVELGRLASTNPPPRLADPPTSARAAAPSPDDITALEAPRGPGLLAHELTHVVQQINAAVLTQPAFAPLRETAEAVYLQAANAARSQTPLLPPIDALRQALSGRTPEGYTLPHSPAALATLGEQVLGSVTPRQAVRLSGTLSMEGEHLILISAGQRYILRDRTGRRFHFSGAGLFIDGMTGRVTGFPASQNDAAIEEMVLTVESIELENVPVFEDTDVNGNGLPDSWELAFLGTLQFSSGDDPDGDGFSLREEYEGGSDPGNPDSVPSGTAITPRNLTVRFDASSELRLEWEGSLNASYQVLISFDLIQWEPYVRPIERNGERHHAMRIEFTEPSAFFRVRALTPAQ